VGLGFLVRLRFALRSLAVWHVRAIAPSFIFGWRAFSSVILCKTIIYLPRRLVVGDVSVIHPAAASFAVGAARTPGFVAAARDAFKRRAYRQVSSALHFVLMSVKSFGRLGAPALTLLGDLAAQAVQAGGPGLSRAAFISGALRELSVALCRGNASLCRSGAYVATRTAGRTPMCGLARPSAEVASACLAPHVWV
jgi:hypothetical protein